MKTDPLSDRINKILDEVFALRGEIFENGNLSACCWLYEGLNQVAADLALMKAAWLPQSPEGSEEEQLDLEMEDSEPAQPKNDFTMGSGTEGGGRE